LRCCGGGGGGGGGAGGVEASQGLWKEGNREESLCSAGLAGALVVLLASGFVRVAAWSWWCGGVLF